MEQLATKPSRKRKWTLDISEAELRMKLRRRTGKVAKYRPKPGTEKSTRICVWDIALLARVPSPALDSFLYGKPNVPGNSCMGMKTLARLNEVLDLVNGGYITKTQYGVYHHWNEPQVAPVVTRRINLDTGRIMGGISAPPKKQRMPSFGTVMGSK